MLYLILSIFSSVAVGVLLKLSKRRFANAFQMISLNYIVAILLAVYFFKADIFDIPDDLPIKTILSLGLLLPSIFLALYYSIIHAGIIKTDIAQRLSLFIPIMAAIFLFKETISVLKYLGLTIGLFSMYFTLSRSVSAKKTSEMTSKSIRYAWLFPVIVFFGFGVIDILFKQLALYATIPYTTTLVFVFVMGLLVSVLINLYFILFQAHSFRQSTLYFGLLLGILNFSNIYCYMKAHQVFSENPTTVFAGMNFGVIIAASIIGVLFFKEKLSAKNIFGLVLAFLAMALILVTQFQ